MDRSRPSGVDRAWPPGWTEPGLRGGQSSASGVDRTRPPTNAMVSEFAPCSFLFFCQLSVNEAGGFSADADVHLNSEVYGKRVGARCQEPRRCGPCNAALSPGKRNYIFCDKLTFFLKSTFENLFQRFFYHKMYLSLTSTQLRECHCMIWTEIKSIFFL